MVAVRTSSRCFRAALPLLLSLLLLSPCAPPALHGAQAVGSTETGMVGAGAARIRIVDYSFEITGKTNENFLRKVLVPDGPEEFGTEEELDAALEAKKQLLLNKRIFLGISYERRIEEEEGGVRPCHVHFLIDDAYTKLFLPYPKFDSNYGLRLGLKVYNKNLFGRFANLCWVSHVSQNNLSFKKPSLYSRLSIDDLPVYGMRFDLGVEFLADLLEPKDSYAKIDISSKNIAIGHAYVAIHPWFAVNPDKAEVKARWGVEEFGNDLDIGPFAEGAGGFMIHNRTVVRKRKNALSTYSSLDYGGIPNATARLLIQTEGLLSPWRTTGLAIGPVLALDCRLLDWMDWRNVFSETNFWKLPGGAFRPSIRWDTSLSRSAVDWKGNFRSGIEFDLSVGLEAPLARAAAPFLDVLKYDFQASVKCFPLVLSWFNPSFRLTGFYSSVPIQMPQGNVGDYIRGIKLKNVKIQGDERKVFLALNADFTFKFITIKNFAKSYVSPFLDWVLIEDAAKAGMFHNLVGVGFDGIVIVNKYPGFPIRASFGVNLLDLIQTIQGTASGMPEYELYIGMDFFY